MKNKKKIETFLGEADLMWDLNDYKEHQKEVPERIKKNLFKTEGELMSNKEIEEWFIDSMQVLAIIKEEDEEMFLKLHKGFVSDLEYLYDLERIDKEILDYVNDLDNFNF